MLGFGQASRIIGEYKHGRYLTSVGFKSCGCKVSPRKELRLDLSLHEA